MFNEENTKQRIAFARQKYFARATSEKVLFETEVREHALAQHLRNIARILSDGHFEAHVEPHDLSDSFLVKNVSWASDSLILAHGKGKRWIFTFGAARSNEVVNSYQRSLQWEEQIIGAKLNPGCTGEMARQYYFNQRRHKEVSSVPEFFEVLIEEIGRIQADIDLEKL